MPTITQPSTDEPTPARRRRRSKPDRRRSTSRAGQLLGAAICLSLFTFGVGTAVAAPPSNDHFAGVTISGPDGTVHGTNTDATGQPGEPNIAGHTPDMSVWYSWVAPESGPTSFNLRDANFDTLLGVFTGNSLPSLVSVASNDDFNGTTQSKVTFNATANTWYRIAVDGYVAAHGAFGLQWAQNSPANDNFASPRVLVGPDRNRTHRVAAARPASRASHLHWGTPDRTVWYSWTAPESGTATFTTPGPTSTLRSPPTPARASPG